MKKKLPHIILFSLSIFANAQNVLTYVGGNALVTVQSNTLFYNGGGLQTASTSTVNNSGNIMVNATSTDNFNVASSSNFYLRLASTASYGQLFISGIPQANITGVVKKEYTADYLNGGTTTNATNAGRQQVGMPFYNFKISDFINAFGTGNLNVTATSNNSAGRFNPSSLFWWNHGKARFDQIAYNGTAYDASGNPSASFISPMTYYIVPRRKTNDGTYFWSPTVDKITVTGTPASDVVANGINNVQFSLSGAYSGSFGTNGNGANYFGERYYSYIDDPFRTKSPSWSTDYGLNLYQMANPFLTNIDLKFIATNEASSTVTDGNYLSNLVGIAYYGSGITRTNTAGTTYTGTAIVCTTNAGAFQAGDVNANRLIIKPMGEFMVKLSNNTAQTINFTKTRRFKAASRADGIDYSVSAARGTTEDGDDGDGIPADKIVKQVAIVMYDLEGLEVDRTYYAVAPSAKTGNDPMNTNLQAYAEGKKIYTKEELPSGGEDMNYVNSLYINEANELDFKSKKIPLYITNDQPYTLKVELYEKGEMVEELSNGKSFYLQTPANQYVKLSNGSEINSVSGVQNIGLYYEMPEGGTLGTNNALLSQTIIAKKNNDWVVRFSKDWKNAKVEVYSAAGQLLNSKSNISTGSDYVIPVNSNVKSVYVVKAISEKGEAVIKKIIN